MQTGKAFGYGFRSASQISSVIFEELGFFGSLCDETQDETEVKFIVAEGYLARARIGVSNFVGVDTMGNLLEIDPDQVGKQHCGIFMWSGVLG